MQYDTFPDAILESFPNPEHDRTASILDALDPFPAAVMAVYFVVGLNIRDTARLFRISKSACSDLIRQSIAQIKKGGRVSTYGNRKCY